MLSGQDIYDMQLKAARKARREGKVPALCEDWDLVNEDARRAFCRNVPFLGEYIPEGWLERADRFFVDTSGFGNDREPAWTQEQFMRHLEKGIAYAFTEVGAFRGYIQTYEKRKVRYE